MRLSITFTIESFSPGAAFGIVSLSVPESSSLKPVDLR